MNFRIFIVSICVCLSITSFARVEYDELENIDQSVQVDRITNSDIEVQMPNYVLKGNYAEVKLKFVSATHPKLVLNYGIINFIINGADIPVAFTNGEAVIPIKFSDSNSLSIYIDDFSFERNITIISLWMIVIPSLLMLAVILWAYFRRK